MCRLFVEADPDLWRSETRSVRIGGVATSVRLEKFYWSTLQDLAARDGLTVGRLISKLSDELVASGRGGHQQEERGDLGNFASFLRVCCGRFLALQASGDLDSDPSSPLRGVDAQAILAREARRRRERLAPAEATETGRA